MARNIDELKKAAEKWAREHPETASKSDKKAKSSSDSEHGILTPLYNFGACAANITRRIGRVGSAILRPAYWLVTHALPFAEPCARGLYRLTMTRPGVDGKRHFAPKRAICSLAIATTLAVTSNFWAAAGYYYGTARWLDNVYVPDAAVFVSQQFGEANQPGKQITPRDEIFTIMGRLQHPDGAVEPVRFDIDYNAFFLTTTARPDLLAARLNSQSPYGVKADVKVTGIYAMLPRYFRVNCLKWLNLRSEIVDVRNVKELTSMPSFVTLDNGGMAKPEQPSAPTPRAALPSPTVTGS